jgi:hypothetical protein
MDANILEEHASVIRVDHEDASIMFLIDTGVHLSYNVVS